MRFFVRHSTGKAVQVSTAKDVFLQLSRSIEDKGPKELFDLVIRQDRAGDLDFTLVITPVSDEVQLDLLLEDQL